MKRLTGVSTAGEFSSTYHFILPFVIIVLPLIVAQDVTLKIQVLEACSDVEMSDSLSIVPR